MGLNKMQGTSAFIEYIGERNNIKRHSCKGCVFYLDAVCKKKNIALDGYTDNNARYCSSYKQVAYMKELQKTQNQRTKSTENKTKKSTKKALQCEHNKEGFCTVRKVWCHTVSESCDITKKNWERENTPTRNVSMQRKIKQGSKRMDVKKTKIYYGDTVTIIEVAKKAKHTFIIYRDPKTIVEKRNQQLFLYKHLNEFMQYNGNKYKIIEIKGQ